MPVDSQPADEFVGRLRETLEQRVDQRQGPPRLLQFGFLLVQSFLSALFFRRVFHALWLLPVRQEQQQVMHNATKYACISLALVVVAQDFFSASLVFVSSNTFSISQRVLSSNARSPGSSVISLVR